MAVGRALMAAATGADIRAELYDRLEDLRAGMLGVGGSEARMRPMTHYLDRDRATLYFLTSRQSDLAAEVGMGALANYCLVVDDDGFYAWIGGTVAPSESSERVDSFWNPVAAAWFTGRDDPDILLLTMPLREAEIWSSTDSTLQFGIEIARANLEAEHEPQVGRHDRLRF